MLSRRDVDLRGHARAAVLDGVADQILQNMLDAGVREYRRQRIVRDLHCLALDHSIQVEQHLREQNVSIYFRHFADAFMRGMSVAKQIVNERTSPEGALAQ